MRTMLRLQGRSPVCIPGGTTSSCMVHPSDTLPMPPRPGWSLSLVSRRKPPRSLEILMSRSLARVDLILGQHLDATAIRVSSLLEKWTKELKSLAKIAASQPHSAYAAYTHGMVSKWSYISRTIPDIGHHLQTLEDTIRSNFIPSITGRSPPNNTVRN